MRGSHLYQEERVKDVRQLRPKHEYHVYLFNAVTLGQCSEPQLIHGTKKKVIPMTGEKLSEVRNLFEQGKAGNVYHHYHLLEPQWRNAIRTETKHVQDRGVYINNGIYH